ncbi:translation initiation factor IF-2 [Bubalus kerabau]|uniref:translation initiation factor IF-2 n=1 Tax=Bubalus carabanensis TaxID=3119969 RepID=UPI00244EF687|nr:translation initiation factor IF-2 [Bubalus carabanensis]
MARVPGAAAAQARRERAGGGGGAGGGRADPGGGGSCGPRVGARARAPPAVRQPGPRPRGASSRRPGHSPAASAGPVTRGSLAPARPSVARAQAAAQPTVPHRPGRGGSFRSPFVGRRPRGHQEKKCRSGAPPEARRPNSVPGRAAWLREPGQAGPPHTGGGGGGGGGGESSARPLRGGAGAGTPGDWSAGSDGQPACPASPPSLPRAAGGGPAGSACDRRAHYRPGPAAEVASRPLPRRTPGSLIAPSQNTAQTKDSFSHSRACLMDAEPDKAGQRTAF